VDEGKSLAAMQPPKPACTTCHCSSEAVIASGTSPKTLHATPYLCGLQCSLEGVAHHNHVLAWPPRMATSKPNAMHMIRQCLITTAQHC
jgi:hypothetical protein